MDGFVRSLSAFKRMLIGMGAVFFFPIAIVGVVATIAPENWPDHYRFTDGWAAAAALVGAALYGWSLDEIFRPRMKREGWRGFFLREEFDFCSTHPSYILIDVLVIAWQLFLSWVLGDVENKVGGVLGGVQLAVAVSFPMLRLFSWYVLGWKIDDAEVYTAHEAPLWAFGIMTGIFGVAAIGVYLGW